MNFLMRSTTHVYSEREKPPSTPPPPEHRADVPAPQGSPSLESLMYEDPYSQLSTTVERFDGEIDAENGTQESKIDATVLVAKHLDVSEEEGWIAMPYSMSYY